MPLSSLYKIVQSDLNAVNEFITTTLKENNSLVIQPLIDHILAEKGKHIRPLLCTTLFRGLTLDHTTKEQEKNIISVTSALELIHMGSLIHDDVIDSSQTRRSQSTINAKWGNKSAVAIGTYVYSIAIKLLCDTNNSNALLSVSQTVKGMCESELSQLCNRNNIRLTEEKYLQIITSKTANLFRTNCECSALISNATPEQKTAVKKFGHSLGLLFQITDDYLDYFSDGSHLKKKVGQDLDQGQVTLPLILLHQHHPHSNLLETPFEKVHELMIQYEIDKQIQSKLTTLQKEASSALDPLAESVYKRALESIAEYITTRVHSITA
jgi:octaprenyl-diphosphate synthase